MRLQRAKSASTSATPAMARSSLRSWPAQNPRPSAASTTTRMPGSAATRSSVACSLVDERARQRVELAGTIERQGRNAVRRLEEQQAASAVAVVPMSWRSPCVRWLKTSRRAG